MSLVQVALSIAPLAVRHVRRSFPTLRLLHPTQWHASMSLGTPISNWSVLRETTWCLALQPPKALHVSKRGCSRAMKCTASEHGQLQQLASSRSLEHTRRQFLQAAAAIAAIPGAPSVRAAALTLEDVTPVIAPSGLLTPGEQTLITIFTTAAPAVASVFDVTLMVSYV